MSYAIYNYKNTALLKTTMIVFIQQKISLCIYSYINFKPVLWSINPTLLTVRNLICTPDPLRRVGEFNTSLIGQLKLLASVPELSNHVAEIHQVVSRNTLTTTKIKKNGVDTSTRHPSGPSNNNEQVMADFSVMS